MRPSFAKRLPILLVLLAPAAPRANGDTPTAQCGSGVHAFEARGFHGFPNGDVFCPLLADPKAMRSFATYQWGDFPEDSQATIVGAVGIADAMGIFRIGGPEQGDGLQLSLEAGVFAQFDLRAPSKDLLNADYLVGFPLTFRRDGFSARLRLYHQSSHLGDELQARTGIAPAGLAFESVELILSQEVGPLRIYAGGEYLFRREPDELDAEVAHGGAELRVGPARGLRLVLALDVKSPAQQEFTPAWSAKGGFEFALWNDPAHPPRVFSVLAEYYDGPSQYGQFVGEDARFWGVGLAFML